jgi:hypothetical protein
MAEHMAEHMADENDAGASYLAALKKSSSPAAAGSAPARALEAPHAAEPKTANLAPGPHLNSSDKRRSPRYKCTGSARIQEIGATVSSWATLADISMHGCYVETSAPLRLGAALTLKLEANGLRIETAGEVRVVYPGLAMGISFSNMSVDNRERLRQLLQPIARPSVIVPSVRLSAPAMSPPAMSSPTTSAASMSPTTQGSRVAADSASPAAPFSAASATVANPAATLQAIQKFFEDRHVMGREEFLRILRTSQS